ncbi:hypothetical protein DFJ58DRAFT_728848 [Suillus subalutaceus]|uniref:uncharacterized protein n=1 Tax=Suillus subalutaceus TaxID=48586 RepID=UPI001B87D425|nr:uncharacterized protein DFJ58DRAFT_728848 [Suillus subalutaceus]KAG1851628.1 hypothetical protein DFJ58DRAFT_728848 [Suillus subalutaceus]
MSHFSQNASDSDDEWDVEPIIESVAIPGPNASKGDFMDALQVLQIQVQKLIEENCTLCEENKVLVAEKPKCKHCTEASDELLAHEQTITLYACKYGMTVEMFPNTNLFSKQHPENPTPFNSQDQYLTAMTQESAFLDELFQHFPDRLHGIMESSYFSDLIRVYFSNTQYRRADITEIQKMLGVSATNPKYKTFPLVLFLGMQEDPTLKTVFGNWKLLAKILKAALRGVTLLHQKTTGSIVWAAIIAIFLLSLDTEFQKSGTGKSSSINYKDLFFHYKKLLLTNNESDISEPIPSSAVQGTTAFQSNTVEVAQPPAALSTVSSLSTTSTLSATFRATVHADAAVPAATNTVVVQDADVERPPAQGRGKRKGQGKEACSYRCSTQ